MSRRKPIPEAVKKEWALLCGMLPGARHVIGCGWCQARGRAYWEVREVGASRVRLEDGFEWDHLIPVSRGGGDELDNLDPCCRPCNRKKGARTVDEYFGVVWSNGTLDYLEEKEPSEEELMEARVAREYTAEIEQECEDEEMRRRAATSTRGG